MILVSVDYTSGVEKAYIKVAYPLPGSPSNQVSSATVTKMDANEKAVTGVNLLADTELYLFGYTGNSNVGGCTHLKHLVMMLDYVPENISSQDTTIELALIQRHFIETSTYTNTLLMDFSLKIKNIVATQLKTHCN